jgi:hypothetical protein
MVTLLLLVGCEVVPLVVSKDSGADTDKEDSKQCCDDTGTDDSEDPDDSEGPDDSGGSDDSTTTDDSDTVPGDWSCDNLPPGALDDTTLDEARAYHGIVFDGDDKLIGWDGRTSLIKNSPDGTREVWLPGLSGIENMDRFPDGDIVAADLNNGRLIRIAPDASYTIVASVQNLYGAGVIIGPDLQIYVADGGIIRVDPESGETTRLFDLPRNWSAHVLNFNLDSTRMYVGSVGNGTLYYFDLDEDLNFVGDIQIYATGVGSGWHDAIAIDICGNLYVPEYYSSGFYRVEPDGTVTSLVDEQSRAYGHGATWSPNSGGWRDDTIYQPQPYNENTVREVVIGLQNGELARTWNGEAVPW